VGVSLGYGVNGLFYWKKLCFGLIIFLETVKIDVNSAISAWKLNVFPMEFFTLFLCDFLCWGCFYDGLDGGAFVAY